MKLEANKEVYLLMNCCVHRHVLCTVYMTNNIFIFCLYGIKEFKKSKQRTATERMLWMQLKYTNKTKQIQINKNTRVKLLLFIVHPAVIFVLILQFGVCFFVDLAIDINKWLIKKNQIFYGGDGSAWKRCLAFEQMVSGLERSNAFKWHSVSIKFGNYLESLFLVKQHSNNNEWQQQQKQNRIDLTKPNVRICAIFVSVWICQSWSLQNRKFHSNFGNHAWVDVNMDNVFILNFYNCFRSIRFFLCFILNLVSARQ